MMVCGARAHVNVLGQWIGRRGRRKRVSGEEGRGIN